MKRDLRKSSKKDLRRLFKIADDLDNEEKDNNDDKEIDEDSDKKDLGKDSPEEQKERTMGDNKEEENNNQVQAPDNAELIKSSIEQISNTGREVLKQVEKFKFNLEQTSRMLSQNPQLSQGMMAKRKSVNEISEKLYQIIFDIENTDISLAFQQESPEAVMDSKNDTRSVGEPKPQPNPGPVPVVEKDTEVSSRTKTKRQIAGRIPTAKNTKQPRLFPLLELREPRRLPC